MKDFGLGLEGLCKFPDICKQKAGNPKPRALSPKSLKPGPKSCTARTKHGKRYMIALRAYVSAFRV